MIDFRQHRANRNENVVIPVGIMIIGSIAAKAFSQIAMKPIVKNMLHSGRQ